MNIKFKSIIILILLFLGIGINLTYADKFCNPPIKNKKIQNEESSKINKETRGTRSSGFFIFPEGYMRDFFIWNDNETIENKTNQTQILIENKNFQNQQQFENEELNLESFNQNILDENNTSNSEENELNDERIYLTSYVTPKSPLGGSIFGFVAIGILSVLFV